MKNPFLRPHSLLLVFVLLVAAPALWSCNSETTVQRTVREHEEQLKIIDEDTIQHYVQRHHLQAKARRTDSGLYVVDSVAGTGAQVTAGKQVRVKYIGRFLSNGAHPASYGYPASYGSPGYPAGSIFENSTTNHTVCGCAVFTVGTLTAGFNEGLLLMRQGDRKLFLVPSRLAYGPGGSSPNIPPDSALLFDVEVLDVL